MSLEGWTWEELEIQERGRNDIGVFESMKFSKIFN